MTQERSEKEHDDYLRKQRQEAYIKPAPNYVAVIQPMLDKDKDKAKQETASDNSGDASSKKDKSKKQ